MEQIISRIYNISSNLRKISKPLLLLLLKESDYVPDFVNTGTILFEQGKDITYWYLLLSGEIELYLSNNCLIQSKNSLLEVNSNLVQSPQLKSKIGRKVIRLKTLNAGFIFGESNLNYHSCSARVCQNAEFIRIPQNHFITIYNQYADYLEPYITILEDVVAKNYMVINSFKMPTSFNKSINQKTLNQTKENFDNVNNAHSKLSSSRSNKNYCMHLNNTNLNKNDYQNSNYTDKESLTYPEMPLNFFPENFFELNNTIPLESLVKIAALNIKRIMQLRSPWLITNCQINKTGNVYIKTMIGHEMTKFFEELCQEVFTTKSVSFSQNSDNLYDNVDLIAEITSKLNQTQQPPSKKFSNLQLVGMWQALMNYQFIRHINFNPYFLDNNELYVWTVDDPLEKFYQTRADFYLKTVLPLLQTAPLLQNMSLGAAAKAVFNGSILPPLSSTVSAANFDAFLFNLNEDASSKNSFEIDLNVDYSDQLLDLESPPKLSNLQSSIFLLSLIGPDCLLKFVLSKAPEERTVAELELIYEELIHIKALSHLSTIVKKELARVIRYEEYQHSGTVLFCQGDPGNSWYIIWQSGSVDVIINGKGVVCTLHEGDDFGKLALVNDAPRSATVTLRQNNSQFLRIDKHDFNKILRDVEANTVRLKEHGQEVLVLEKILPQITNHNPNLQSSSKFTEIVEENLSNKLQCCYSVVAGTPEKMVEYLLETRIDAALIYAVSFTQNDNNVIDLNLNNDFKPDFLNNLTKSCCINYNDLPLKFVDDVDSGIGNGYMSDGNINYNSKMTNNKLLKTTKTILSSLANNSNPSCFEPISHLNNQQKKKFNQQLNQNKQTPPLIFVVDNVDVSLEDFILTHMIFMPSNILCNYLKQYYNYKRNVSTAPNLPLPHQIQNKVLTNYCITENNLQDLEEQSTAKRRVVSFLVIWQYILGLHFFLDSVANSFVEEIFCCVLEDANYLPNMRSVVEQIKQLRLLREYAMTILSRHPTLILDCGIYSSQAPAPMPVLPIDICNQCIYLADTTFITMNVCLNKSASEIAAMASAKIRRQRQIKDRNRQKNYLTAAVMENNHKNKMFLNSDYDSLDNVTNINVNTSNANETLENEDSNDCFFLVEVKSNGERVVYSPTEVSVPTMLSLNGKLYVIYPKEIDSLLPLPEQNEPSEGIYHSVLDLIRSRELAQQLAVFHTQLFNATDEIELVFQVIGRDQFMGRNSANLDLLLRRFNEVQYWTSTEILLASSMTKRLSFLKKFIKIAMHLKQMGDLMSVFAITLGLSNVAVSRLSHLWMKLPAKSKRQYAEFEALLDPSRNHRAYRLLVSKLNAPIVPFVPLLLKDLTFVYEGNKTSFAGLINFEKMHMIANILRNFRNCKSSKYQFGMIASKKKTSQGLIRNFQTIDNQRRLMELSYLIEPPNSSIVNLNQSNLNTSTLI